MHAKKYPADCKSHRPVKMHPANEGDSHEREYGQWPIHHACSVCSVLSEVSVPGKNSRYRIFCNENRPSISIPIEIAGNSHAWQISHGIALVSWISEMSS
jgi:hypothetical protein